VPSNHPYKTYNQSNKTSKKKLFHKQKSIKSQCTKLFETVLLLQTNNIKKLHHILLVLLNQISTRQQHTKTLKKLLTQFL